MSNIIPYNDARSLDHPNHYTSDRGATIEAIIGAWLHEKTRKSVKTKTAYENTIKDFREVLLSAGYDLLWKGDDFLPTVADYAQVFASARSGKARRSGDASSATQAQRLAILSSFYLFAIKRKHIAPGNPIDSIDRPHVDAYAQAQGIEQEELEARLRAINLSTLQGARDMAILTVLLSTGRRVSEVAHLTRKDVEVAGNKVKLVFHAKGGKTMRDTLSPEVSTLLLQWLSLVYPGQFLIMPDDTPLWVNVHHKKHWGAPLGYHGFAGICKHYLGTSKVHTTRHTFALLMEIAGAKITDTQQRLGHENPATTGIYLQKLTQDRNAFSGKLAELLGLREKDE